MTNEQANAAVHALRDAGHDAKLRTVRYGDVIESYQVVCSGISHAALTEEDINRLIADGDKSARDTE